MTTDATPARRDVTFVAGDHLDLTIPLTDAAGADVSLSGWTVEAERRPSTGAEDAALSVAISGSAVRITATPTQTAAWPEFNEFDVRLTSADETLRITPVSGQLRALPAITD